MSENSEDEDKQYEPTQKKLDDARKKGEFAKSADLNTAAVYAGFLLALSVVGFYVLQSVGTAMAILIGQPDQLAPMFFEGNATPVTARLLGTLAPSLSALFGIPIAALVLMLILQKNYVFAPDKLIPKLSRISLISNAKNKFGRSGLFEFAKSASKLIIYAIVLWVFLFGKIDLLMGVVHLPPTLIGAAIGDLIIQFLSIVLFIALGIGGIDYLFQQNEHERKNRMSRKEITDETKQQDGDPHMKQQRRQRGYDIAMNQMLADVPNADVIIVNPTHYAVALKWNRAEGRAPTCVAKGVDEVAARIRETAHEAGVPIHSDPPTARAIYATVDIGNDIPPDNYAAVAAAIRFAEAMREKAKSIRSKANAK
ncbi:EscU/YscU/HrcU family type III secretion system export apparatus switch protein [Cochlodiniinecator piscidefendens]|uniref:EscU/YscU/HrcU family type III secretion system export apparatus switch protein n=1 Tax=Cochlodiniinecator piscidefendens TaxID=2715756 RepID=UPI00140C0627|nr:flagellar type III secretion system protein FlhB [Cochlodiniinecator piscidefendens]